MWVLSVDAGTLLSVVKFNPAKSPTMAKKHGAEGDQDYLLIRARVKQSLEYVADVLDALYLGEVEGYQRPIVDSDPAADYKYRTIVTRDEWKAYLVYEADGIDYDSHVKEETVARQPEPKIANLYSALSATWSAWSKLQDTPPYGAWKSYAVKPDCKNCNHTELKHTVKGDRCNHGMVWKGKGYEPTAEACDCTKYEPKPAAVAAPVAKSAKDSAAVFQQQEIGYQSAYPASVYGSGWDVPEDNLSWVGEDGNEHLSWCAFWDGDSCICKESDADADDPWEGSIRVTHAAVTPEDGTVVPDVGVWVNGQVVEQEAPVAGESRKAKKNRLERNRRARRAARLALK